MQESEKLSFARAVLDNTFDLDVVVPIDREAALRESLSEIEDLLSLNNPEIRQRRFDHFRVPGTTPESYREKIFELDSSRPFLAGIRHVGGDPNLPFINVTAGFEVKTGDTAMIAAVLENEFKSFHPSHFAVWMKSIAESVVPKNEFKPARRYLARRMSDLDLSSRDSETIQIRVVEDESHFAWYEDEYQKFHNSNPTLKSWVTISEKEDLERYRSQGLLYGAYLKGALIGLVGGESLNLLGFSGLYLGELLISEQNKGRSFAIQMQRQFIRQNADKFEVVWGTIDARNLPSTKTALRIGRKPMRTEFFVTLGYLQSRLTCNRSEL